MRAKRPFEGTCGRTASNSGGDIDKDGGDAVKAAHEKPLNSIREMNAALRTCWMPPPKDSARHGMEYTIRFAFKRDAIEAQKTTHRLPAFRDSG
jgi:hypothetical protein